MLTHSQSLSEAPYSCTPPACVLCVSLSLSLCTQVAGQAYETTAAVGNRVYETGAGAAGATYETGREGARMGASAAARASLSATQALEDARRGYEMVRTGGVWWWWGGAALLAAGQQDQGVRL